MIEYQRNGLLLCWALPFIFMLLAVQVSRAETLEHCTTTHSIATNFSKLQCALSCEDYWQKFPATRPAPGSTAYCEDAAGTIQHLLRGSTWADCGSSLWTGLQSFAERARLYLALIAWTSVSHLERAVEALRSFKDYAKKTGDVEIKITAQDGSRIIVKIGVGKFLPPNQALAKASASVLRAQRDLRDMETILTANQEHLRHLQAQMPSGN